LLQPRLVGGGLRFGGDRLATQEFIMRTRHRGDVNALAEETGTSELALGGLQIHLLARKARDVGVGDVVAGGLQRGVVGRQRAHADRQQ
jgi:hypothetical protein